MYSIFISFLLLFFVFLRNNSPNALELKCIEVWLISCTLFVFFALIEYFVVLFGIRYDKHWRHRRRDLDRTSAVAPVGAAGAPAATAAASSTNMNNNASINTIIHTESNNTSG